MLRIISLLAITTLTAAQGSCTSFSTLVHGTNGAPAGLGIPDCSYIQANAPAICSTLGSWDIINGNACQMRGPGYGCQFSSAVFSTQETFYCQLGPAAVPTSTASHSTLPTVSSTASASVTPSPSASGSASASATASATASTSATATASATETASATASTSATATATATATSTHTINPVYIYVNTTNLVPITVTDTSINKGEAAAIGLAAIFGVFTVGCLCLAFSMRRKPLEKEQLPSRRPSVSDRGVVIRDPPSRRPSVVVLKSEV